MNGKKIMNHLRSNKDIGKTKRTRSRTHGGDRKARPITNHDRRKTRRVSGSDGREDTGIRSGVERGTQVGDPLGVDRRRQSHGVEGLCQSGLVPPPRPGRLLAGLSWRGPVRCGEGSNTGEHGRWLELRTRPPPGPWNGDIEMRPDHGLLKDGQGVPPRAGAGAGASAPRRPPPVPVPPEVGPPVPPPPRPPRR